MAWTALVTGVNTGVSTAAATTGAARARLNCARAMTVHPSSRTSRSAAAATNPSWRAGSPARSASKAPEASAIRSSTWGGNSGGIDSSVGPKVATNPTRGRPALLASAAANRLSGQDPGELAVLEGELAVHQHVDGAFGVLARLLVGGVVENLGLVEDREVGKEARLEAGSDVIPRTAYGMVISFSSRTSWVNFRVKPA